MAVSLKLIHQSFQRMLVYSSNDNFRQTLLIPMQARNSREFCNKLADRLIAVTKKVHGVEISKDDVSQATPDDDDDEEVEETMCETPEPMTLLMVAEESQSSASSSDPISRQSIAMCGSLLTICSRWMWRGQTLTTGLVAALVLLLSVHSVQLLPTKDGDQQTVTYKTTVTAPYKDDTYYTSADYSNVNYTTGYKSEDWKSNTSAKHRLASRSFDFTQSTGAYRSGERYRGNYGDPQFWVVTCPTIRYRTYDGYCNNLVYPKWGQATKPYARLLLPKYQDDRGSPRIQSVFGDPLPSGRIISLRLARDFHKEYPYYSHMLMQWGQFVNHDLTNKPVWTDKIGSEISCCGPNPDQHPDCYPLDIPNDDPFYQQYKKRCMNFVRSKPYPGKDYISVYREQYNENTAFIDASGVYGSSKAEAIKLRALVGGRLKSTKMDGYKDLLPTSPEGLCRNQVCFKAGDFRANMFPSLSSMHTLFLREHNYIVGQLQRINPSWSDERLYQEGRKIVGAITQHITFNEFLPIVLGKEQMDYYDLLLQNPGYFSSGYDVYLNPTIYNAFTGAAFRFGHSLVQPQFKRYYGNHVERPWSPWLGDEYFNTSCMWQGGEMDDILVGLVDQHAQLTDPFFSVEITNRLYESGTMGGGLDLVTLNIQRGRDNGLPPYNDWRQFCGLKRVESFQELGEYIHEYALEVFQALYKSVDDIDLYVGGIAEIPVSGGIVGPTFACIIGRQFYKLRAGDRFWFENGMDSVGAETAFTIEQLDEIRKSSLARIICDNTDDIDTIQPKVMYTASEWNQRTLCSDYSKIPDIDLSKWEESTDNFYYPGNNAIPQYRNEE